MKKVVFADKMIKDLKNDIEKATIKASKKAKEIMLEESSKIYEEFDPISYQRRYEDGGFRDENNIVSIMVSNDNTHKVTGRNDTMIVTYNGMSEEDYLDFYIENGVYNWKRKPSARPFAARSQERIDNGEVTDVINDYLKGKGYNVD